MIHRFGVFEFESDSGELRKNGRAVAIEPQPAKALALLLSRAGDVVSREELRDAVWGADTHVDFDRGIAYVLSQIRSALGDSGDNPRFVQTIPRRGVRFVAPVASVAPVAPVAPAEPVAPASHVLQAPPPFPPPPRVPKSMLGKAVLIAGGVLLLIGGYYAQKARFEAVAPRLAPVIIGVSIFDNETGLAQHDRLVAGLSDLVVERLTRLEPGRVAVIGNAAVLRQPRNIRNLKAVAENVKADYVLLGQLQQGENGLRFITHFIRLSDEAHLRANRLIMPGGGVEGLESAVVGEFERAVREHILNRASN